MTLALDLREKGTAVAEFVDHNGPCVEFTRDDGQLLGRFFPEDVLVEKAKGSGEAFVIYAGGLLVRATLSAPELKRLQDWLRPLWPAPGPVALGPRLRTSALAESLERLAA
jgi:hypothetical protein